MKTLKIAVNIVHAMSDLFALPRIGGHLAMKGDSALHVPAYGLMVISPKR